MLWKVGCSIWRAEELRRELKKELRLAYGPYHRVVYQSFLGEVSFHSTEFLRA
jgi:hypothetical protein